MPKFLGNSVSSGADSAVADERLCRPLCGKALPFRPAASEALKYAGLATRRKGKALPHSGAAEPHGPARILPPLLARGCALGPLLCVLLALLLSTSATSLRAVQAQGPSQQPAGRAPQNQKPPRDYSIALPPKPDFSALDWLAGDWTGQTADKHSPGDVHINVVYALDRRYMVFNEWIALPATKTAPATRESWIGILTSGPSGSGLVFHSYSSTGFVLRYRVVADGNQISFFPEGGDPAPAGWLFRRTLARVADGTFTETVQAAPPNQPFFDYYTARLTRVAAAQASPPGPPAPSKPATAGSSAAPAGGATPGSPPAKDNVPPKDTSPTPPHR